MKARPLVVALVLLLVTATALAAHDLFIEPASFFVAPGRATRLPMLNGTFTKSENAVTRDRVADIAIVSPAGVSHPTDVGWQATGDTTFIDFHPDQPGTYVVGVSTRTRELSLDGKAFDAYLKEEGIDDIRARRRARHEMERAARERYAKHVKAVLQVGDPRTANFDTRLGFPAEIVPLENPYYVHAYGSLRVQCFIGGVPARRLTVLAGHVDALHRIREQRLVTDAEGIARVPVGASGRWFVKFVRMVPAAGGVDYESQWATLTFEIAK